MIVGVIMFVIISKNKFLRKYYSMNIFNLCCCKKKVEWMDIFFVGFIKVGGILVLIYKYFEFVFFYSDGLVINGIFVNIIYNFMDVIMFNII